MITQFVNNGTDLEVLNKSYESMPLEHQEELAKALKKDGLVLVDVQVNGKHGTYTRKQWKKASDVKKNEGKSSKGVPQVIKGKHMSDLKDNLKEHGLVLDSVHNNGIQDNEEVTMYDKDKNTYTAKANRYSDGGVELRKITKENKEKTATDNGNGKQQDSGNPYPDYVNKTNVGVPKAHSSSYFSEKKAIEFAKQLHDNGATNIEISSAEDAFNQTQYLVAWDKEEKKQSDTKAGNKPTKKAAATSKVKQDSSSNVSVPKTKADIQSMLASGKSRNDIIELAKKSGISWKENGHEGINWMRCCMALTKASK